MAKFTTAIVICTGFIVGLVLWVYKTPKNETVKSVQPGEQVLGRWRTGPENAPVKIVEFADFECPACAVTAPIIAEVVSKYPDKVSLAFIHYPLPQHKRAIIAANAAEAAGEQGKFWDMVKLLYLRQIEWITANDPESLFGSYAGQISIDPAPVLSAVKSKLYTSDRIDEDYWVGERLGVNSTPTFLVNGQIFRGVVRLEEWESMIQKILAEVDSQPFPS